MKLSHFPRGGHDHATCVAEALGRAAEICHAAGARLTPLRKQILAAIWESHTPVGAYEIIDKLRDKGRAVAPITVYRVLEFLMAHGLVHRLATRNAFVGCGHAADDSPHPGQFLICERCSTVAELDDEAISRAIGAGAKKLGFLVGTPIVEISGICPRCREPAQSDNLHAR